MGKLLSVNEILLAQDLPQERVEVPEWNGDVIVRALSAADREWFERSMLRTETIRDDDGKMKTVDKVVVDNARAKLLSRALVDEEGNALFDEAQMIGLGKKSNTVVQRLFLIAQRLSALGQNNADDAEKNSDADPKGDSSSV
jgi:hypothetical protein